LYIQLSRTMNKINNCLNLAAGRLFYSTNMITSKSRLKGLDDILSLNPLNYYSKPVRFKFRRKGECFFFFWERNKILKGFFVLWRMNVIYTGTLKTLSISHHSCKKHQYFFSLPSVSRLRNVYFSIQGEDCWKKIQVYFLTWRQTYSKLWKQNDLMVTFL